MALGARQKTGVLPGASAARASNRLRPVKELGGRNDVGLNRLNAVQVAVRIAAVGIAGVVVAAIRVVAASGVVAARHAVDVASGRIACVVGRTTGRVAT